MDNISRLEWDWPVFTEGNIDGLGILHCFKVYKIWIKIEKILKNQILEKNFLCFKYQVQNLHNLLWPKPMFYYRQDPPLERTTTGVLSSNSSLSAITRTFILMDFSNDTILPDENIIQYKPIDKNYLCLYDTLTC